MKFICEIIIINTIIIIKHNYGNKIRLSNYILEPKLQSYPKFDFLEWAPLCSVRFPVTSWQVQVSYRAGYWSMTQHGELLFWKWKSYVISCRQNQHGSLEVILQQVNWQRQSFLYEKGWTLFEKAATTGALQNALFDFLFTKISARLSLFFSRLFQKKKKNTHSHIQTSISR